MPIWAQAFSHLGASQVRGGGAGGGGGGITESYPPFKLRSGVLARAGADALLGGGVTDGDAGATRGASSFAALGAGTSAGF